MLGAHGRRAVDFGQAIDVGDAMPMRSSLRSRGGGADRRSGRETVWLDAGAQLFRRIDQHAVDDRRAAEMRHAMFRGSASKMSAASTLRRHTLVPACRAMVQGKHQPLQWNIGSVHR